MSRRRERRRSERIEQLAAARRDPGQVEELVAMMRPHMAAIGDDLATVNDPFEAELAGGAILGLLAGLEQFDSDRAAVRLVEDVALQGDTSARALLVFMGLGPDRNLASLARQADAVLDAAGVQDPVWADKLFQPVEPTRFTRITVPGDRMEAWLLVLFRRSDEEHGFLVGIDYTDCGAISMLDPVPPSHVRDLVERIEAGELLDDIPTVAEDLDEEQGRVFLDGAIGATLDHWAEEDDETEDDLDADLLPGRIILLGRRLNEAGMVGDPPVHGAHVPINAETSIKDLLRMPLPPKTIQDTPPILQLRAELDQSEPEIWRRLEVPADSSLADLHGILQAAFGWSGAHSHCFVTPFGEYSATAALTCENEADVALGQVLPAAGDDITYLYDFTDNWDHTITVEAVHPRDPEASYPLCTAGAEAAPPEDAGGIEAWQHLREALADTAHPDHRQLVGENTEEDLEPFDPTAINARLRGAPTRDS
ncbi:plasmid pRiA4b ORF-3 family protein [Glycomyces sp. L485]|uniref:plasmid pRiA4b ORF-3 family protein n=1 Tax=Glycomyces sp. L485 TaxID=2909235 RepID=UPI001F4AEAFC|nr:plasmid pRiA4b ORF-3 family protein [Glycomyces sp. L485]MCH7232597.1 plasmid pRiA4b ORF-3 family protein [Glycomyces sp. L485]